MTKTEVFDLIDRRLEEINEKLETGYSRESGYEFLKEYVANNKIIKIDDFIEADIWDALVCIYYIERNNKDINEAISDIEEIKKVCDNEDPRLSDNIINFIIDMAKIDQIDMVKDYFKAKGKIKDKLKLKHMIKENETAALSMPLIKGELEDLEVNIIPLLTILQDKEKIDIIGSLHALVEVQHLMLEDREASDEAINELDLKIRNKEKNRLFKKMLDDMYKTDRILARFRDIGNYFNNIEKEEKKVITNLQNEKRILEDLYTKLKEQLEKEEITIAREIVKPIKDSEIKLSVLELIKDHNDVYHKKLESKLEELNSDTTASYLLVLNDYGIKMDKKEISNIMHNSSKEVSKILEILTKFNFDNKSIINVLSNSNLEIIELVKSYIDKGYLTADYLNDNHQLLYFGSKRMKNYIECLEFLNSLGINPAIFCDSLNLLFNENDVLQSNIEILGSYGLLNNLRTTDNYYFLSDDNLVEKIDKLIELGYFSYLEENLDILNNQNIRRLELLHFMNMEIDSKEELLEILNREKFFISDDSIEEYIPNVKEYYQSMDLGNNIDILDEYSNKLVYDFNGILISTNKVKRLMNEGYNLYDAIFYNTSFSLDEYEQIKSVLKDYVYSKS